MNYKSYFLKLRFFALFAFLIFLIGGIGGYLFAGIVPGAVDIFFQEINDLYQPVLEMNSFGQLLFIILNNGFTLFSILFLSVIFGIFPFLVLFLNGGILGIFAFFFQQNSSLSEFFLGIAPHGIIEIPVVIFACASGFKIGKIAFRKLSGKETRLKEEVVLALNFFLKILLPFLILAAVIEVFITGNLLN